MYSSSCLLLLSCAWLSLHTTLSLPSRAELLLELALLAVIKYTAGCKILTDMYTICIKAYVFVVIGTLQLFIKIPNGESSLYIKRCALVAINRDTLPRGALYYFPSIKYEPSVAVPHRWSHFSMLEFLWGHGVLTQSSTRRFIRILLQWSALDWQWLFHALRQKVDNDLLPSQIEDVSFTSFHTAFKYFSFISLLCTSLI